jgi:hypothetical protein
MKDFLIIVLFVFLIIVLVIYPKEITYIENGTNINAIEYKNEIYLKKGE